MFGVEEGEKPFLNTGTILQNTFVSPKNDKRQQQLSSHQSIRIKLIMTIKIL